MNHIGVGVLIGLLLTGLILGVLIIKSDGYFIARNPFFGPEKTKKEQEVGFYLAPRLIWFCLTGLVIIAFLLWANFFVRVALLIFFLSFSLYAIHHLK